MFQSELWSFQVNSDVSKFITNQVIDVSKLIIMFLTSISKLKIGTKRTRKRTVIRTWKLTEMDRKWKLTELDRKWKIEPRTQIQPFQTAQEKVDLSSSIDCISVHFSSSGRIRITEFEIFWPDPCSTWSADRPTIPPITYIAPDNVTAQWWYLI